VNVLRPASLEDLQHEFALEQRLASTEGDSALTSPVTLVSDKDPHQFIGSIRPASHLESIAQTGRDTVHVFATVTDGTIEFQMGIPVVVDLDGMLRTGRNTAMVLMGALLVPVHEARSQELSLRIGAPGTAERATAEEYEGPAPWSVMDRVSLDVKDEAISGRYHFVQTCSVYDEPFSGIKSQIPNSKSQTNPNDQIHKKGSEDSSAKCPPPAAFCLLLTPLLLCMKPLSR
jgi:hypothetical protein